MQIPLGVSNFGKLIKRKHLQTHEGYVYVDKSLFIKEVLDDGAEVLLFTRPRRFGKTLNLSLLQHFFAAEVSGEPTKGLFTGLKISDYPEYMAYQGKYPVIFISFKDIKASNFASCINQMIMLMHKTYKEHEHLFTEDNFSKDDLSYVDQIFNQSINKDTLQGSLYTLIRLLYKHYQVRPILLIDEYDTPLHHAYVHKYYEELIDFLRNMFSSALRDNAMLDKAVLTGILRVSKESLFSGLNHIAVYSLLERQYAEYFGFTELETTELLNQASLKYKLQAIKSWYNGYNFGRLTIYNPWSILQCVKEKGTLRPYWVNTSGNELLKHLIINAGNEVKESIENLIQGETINELVDEHIVFADLDTKPAAIWSLLLLSGYLKYTNAQLEDLGYRCALTLPNKEIGTVYVAIIKEWLHVRYGATWQTEFLTALLAGDTQKLTDKLENMVLETLSCHDVNKKVGESFYHGLMLGLVSGLKDTYIIKSNREAGLGRYDIALIPKDHQQPGVVIELKYSASAAKLAMVAKEALTQISAAKYTMELQELGIKPIRTLGLAFSRKKLKIMSA